MSNFIQKEHSAERVARCAERPEGQRLAALEPFARFCARLGQHPARRRDGSDSGKFCEEGMPSKRLRGWQRGAVLLSFVCDLRPRHLRDHRRGRKGAPSGSSGEPPGVLIHVQTRACNEPREARHVIQLDFRGYNRTMATQTKTTMQAIAIDSYGGLDKLHVRELPIPEPKSGEVRVRVRAAGVGIWDAMQRTGAFPPEHEAFPMVVGAECAGTIDAIGPNVHGALHAGAEVYAYFYGDQGAYAQYVCINADAVALKPKNLSFIEAAAVPVDGITAHQALVDELRVAAGQTVLIAGGAGGVGTLAVQIAAKVLDARVIATAGTANLDYVRSLGASDVIDYTADDVIARVKKLAAAGVDAALDCVGRDDNGKATIKAVRDGGRFAELVGEDVPDERGITIAHVESAPSSKRLDTLRKLFEDGTLRVEIARTYPLADARSAQEQVETRHTRGKIVLVVD